MKYKIFLLFIFSILYQIVFTQTIIPTDTVCIQGENGYSVSAPQSNSTYTWGLNQSGGTILPTSRNDSIRIRWNDDPGIDTLWVFETNSGGCSSNKGILRIVKRPLPSVSLPKERLCSGDTLFGNPVGEAPFTVYYTFNGNKKDQKQLPDYPFITGTESGTYILDSISDKYCTGYPSGITQAVILPPLPGLTIETLFPGDSLFIGDTLICIARTPGANSTLHWTAKGDHILSDIPGSIHQIYVIWKQEGVYPLTVLEMNQEGCQGEIARKMIKIFSKNNPKEPNPEPDEKLYIPNIISPNTDGINEVFHIKGINNESYHLSIYNRWGQLVYEGNPYSNDWKGTDKKGHRLSPGVYYYILHHIDTDKIHKGTLHLFR